MSYMEMLRAVKSQTCHPPLPSKPSKPLCEGVRRSFEGFEGSDSPPISRNTLASQARSIGDELALIERGLTRLRRDPWPRMADPAAWWITIGDAIRLHADGWANKALALGWTRADLFGIGRQGSDQFTGLAAWLDGRRVTMLDQDGAHAGPWCRGFMGPDAGRYRRRAQPDDAVMLWDWGRK